METKTVTTLNEKTRNAIKISNSVGVYHMNDQYHIIGYWKGSRDEKENFVPVAQIAINSPFEPVILASVKDFVFNSLI